MLHGIQSIDWLRLIWVACVFAAAQAWAVAQAAEPPPPNIVWLTDTGDLGFVLPETTLVKDHIWPPEGQQPATPPAEIEDKAVLRGDSMVFVVSLSCPDPGASIGYRLGTEKQYSGPWQVYTTPFEVPADRRFIEVRTHRIGHTPTTTGALLGGE